MRRAMTNAGISFEKSPKGPKPREQSANGKQRNKFAGTVKNNKATKVAQRSLVQVPDKNEVSDSDDDNQPEYGGMMAITVYVNRFFRGFTGFFRKTYHFFPQTGMCTFRTVYITVWRI